jgi:hypothetical protein
VSDVPVGGVSDVPVGSDSEVSVGSVVEVASVVAVQEPLQPGTPQFGQSGNGQEHGSSLQIGQSGGGSQSPLQRTLPHSSHRTHTQGSLSHSKHRLQVQSGKSAQQSSPLPVQFISRQKCAR